MTLSIRATFLRNIKALCSVLNGDDSERTEEAYSYFVDELETWLEEEELEAGAFEDKLHFFPPDSLGYLIANAGVGTSQIIDGTDTKSALSFIRQTVEKHGLDIKPAWSSETLSVSNIFAETNLQLKSCGYSFWDLGCDNNEDDDYVPLLVDDNKRDTFLSLTRKLGMKVTRYVPANQTADV